MQANNSSGHIYSAKPGIDPGHGSSDHPLCWSLDPFFLWAVLVSPLKNIPIYRSGNPLPWGLIPKAIREEEK